MCICVYVCIYTYTYICITTTICGDQWGANPQQDNQTNKQQQHAGTYRGSNNNGQTATTTSNSINSGPMALSRNHWS